VNARAIIRAIAWERAARNSDVIGRGRVGVLRRGLVVAIVAGLAGCGGAGDLRLGLSAADAPQTLVLSATVDSTTQRAALTWTSAGSNLSYRIERNGIQVGGASDTQWTDTGLAAGQRDCWQVFAANGFGWQARSNEACVSLETTEKGWRIEKLAGGRWPALAIDPTGEVQVCFASTTGTGISVLRVGTGRTPETLDAAGESQCSIAVDRTGTPHVAFLSAAGLRHAVRGGDGWSVSTVDAQAYRLGERTDGPALALDAAGVPRIAYRRITTSGRPVIAIAIRSAATTGTWKIDPGPVLGRVGPRALVITTDGTSRFVTVDEVEQLSAVWRRTAAGWPQDVTLSPSPTRGDGPPFVLDPSGAPRFAWWQRVGGASASTAALRWITASGADWSAETIATDASLGTRVAVSLAESRPRVASIDASGTVRLHTRGDTEWTLETLSAQGGAAVSVDLSIEASGQVRLVYDRIVEGSVVLASRLRE